MMSLSVVVDFSRSYHRVRKAHTYHYWTKSRRKKNPII